MEFSESVELGKAHLTHFEDAIILKGSQGAQEALQTLASIIQHPNTVTEKFDGYPALIFGHDINGKFTVVDKHMFDQGVLPASPQDFIQHDLNRGADRSNLHFIIGQIWNPLRQASDNSKGFYWGDLLLGYTPKPVDGKYIFQPNPKGIRYEVAEDSALGKYISTKVATIAVHQYIDPGTYLSVQQQNQILKASGKRVKKLKATDFAISLNGGLGELNPNTKIGILPSKLPVTPSLQIDSAYINSFQSKLQQLGDYVDILLSGSPVANNVFKEQYLMKYINWKVRQRNLNVSADEFIQYVDQNIPMSDAVRKNMLYFLNRVKPHLNILFALWRALYAIKLVIYRQMNMAAKQSPLIGYLQTGQRSQEGFVAQGYKFIDRLKFSAQNLQGR
jgi:hypothetical protein